ncbi:hypothetical protein GCM10027614_71530 [Micromonospora vulcania]
MLLAALGATLLWRRDRQPDGTPLFGLGALVIAATAISLAVAFSAELVFRVADFLDRDTPTGEGIATGPARAYIWAIFGFFRAVLITLIVAGLATLFSRRRRYRAAAAIVARDYPDPGGGRTSATADTAGDRPRPVHRDAGTARRGLRLSGGCRHRRHHPRPAGPVPG